MAHVLDFREIVPEVFFLNDTATTEIYTLSLHDALPISRTCSRVTEATLTLSGSLLPLSTRAALSRSLDRKSTRLNSSHGSISYAVFCLKKKKKKHIHLFSYKKKK